jgi:hypothetical protein
MATLSFGMPSLPELGLCGCFGFVLIAVIATVVVVSMRNQGGTRPTPQSGRLIRFKIEGVDRETGEPASFELRSENVSAAREAAAKAGYVVSRAYPISD